jgi:hypothetical protein
MPYDASAIGRGVARLGRVNRYHVTPIRRGRGLAIMMTAAAAAVTGLQAAASPPGRPYG